MSGIAGILRRDGREVPKKWVNLLEQSLLHSGNILHRFEDTIPIQKGNLHIILLGSDFGTVPKVVDGDESGECAIASWNQETFTLELSRKGTGQKSLYWLDLDVVGEGLVFCSNPLPLLQISHDLELPNEHLSQGVHEYLQLGYAIEGGALLSPLCSIPLQATSLEFIDGVNMLECDMSPTLAEDIVTLVKILGKPFSDINLLSKLWQYRVARNKGVAVLDGLLIHESNQGTMIEKLKQSHFLKRVLPPNEVERLHQEHRSTAKRIELGAIANYVGVAVDISDERTGIQPSEIPYSSWLRSPQSSLGQLASKTFNSADAFQYLPVEQQKCIALLDSHRNGEEDYSEQLFALLTLALWHQSILA